MKDQATIDYGVATPAQIATKTGREVLQAIIDGALPHPPISRTLSFWIVEVGDGWQLVAPRDVVGRAPVAVARVFR